MTLPFQTLREFDDIRKSKNYSRSFYVRQLISKEIEKNRQNNSQQQRNDEKKKSLRGLQEGSNQSASQAAGRRVVAASPPFAISQEVRPT